MSIETGGPAFPVDCYFKDGKPSEGRQTGLESGMAMGMTLRDYFAQTQMPLYFGKLSTRFDTPKPVEYKLAAEACYRDADAMIKERNKG